MHPPAMLRTVGIVLRFGDFCALRGVDFSIAENDAVGIIGPNGAGKTTFLNVLTGQCSPEEGSIYLRGRDITSLRVEKRVRLGIVRTFQIVHVFDNLTVYDNVAMSYLQKREGMRFPLVFFFADLRRRRDIREATERALSEFDLAKARDAGVASLSLGTKKKLEIAMAWVAEPEVLLLDEPFAGIGDSEIDEVISTLKKIVHRKTLLIVEHKLSKLSQLVDTLAVMHDGRIIASGPCEETLRAPEVRKCYWKVDDAAQRNSVPAKALS